MKNKSLILSLLLVLVALVLSVFGVNVKAAGNESEALSIEGVQIREAEGEVVSGMRFVAETNGYTPAGEVTAYGVSIAFGEAEAAEITIGATVNGKSVLSAQVSETAENKYFINLIDIPTSMYGQKVTARAYVVDNGEVVYSSTAVTKCYGQAALDITAAGKDKETTKAIVAELTSNYKNVYKDSFGNVFVANALYETNPVKLEEEFVADWNAKFGTEFTEFKYATWATSASAGYGEGTGMTANGDTDCSGTNAYEFFITDEATSAKWGWLLTFFLEETNTYVHPKRQINALLNNGSYSDSYGGGLQQFAHLSRSLQNFFDAKGTDVYGSGIDVIIKDFSVYATIENYNTTVYAKDANFVACDSEIALEALVPETGYEFKGYQGTDLYNGTYVVSETSEALIATFEAIEYTITYFNGENELTDIAGTYTVVDAVTLPTDYEIAGTAFGGWYDNAEFEGEPVLGFDAGQIGNKVYYGKFEEKAAVTVTYDTDGGYLALYPSVDAAIADFLADYNTARGKSHTVNTFYELGSWGEISDASLFLYNTTYRTKWSWLVTYIAGVASNANKQAWTTFNDFNSQSELNAANSNNIYRIAYELRGWVGQTQYTKNGNFPSADYSTAAVKAAYVTAVTLPTEYVYYNEAFTLPTPIKENHTFLGWVDSEGNVVTQYPGYDVECSITYTATWEANYANVSVTYNTNGGHFSMLYDPNAKVISTYDNVGGASGTYLCDTNVTKTNSLRWQYKVLLQYDEALNAYKVVCLDAAKASAANAASAAGVTWTHALSNSGSNITTQFEVGQYVYIDGTPAVGDKNIGYVVLADAAAIAAYTYPTTYSEVLTAPVTLVTPIREGYTFVGWKSSVDGSVVTEFPGYAENPGTVTYTAQWQAN